jgi:uncharacterized protein YndB with AHSA1/START domain
MMTSTYRRSFTVAVPVERAWQAFTEPAELTAWFAPSVERFEAEPGGGLEFAVGGTPAEGRMLEVEPGRRLRWSQGPGVLPGTTEVTVVFEAVEHGTRIEITHAGFGDGRDWIDELQAHTLGWNRCITDLTLYLERGVRRPRAHARRSRFGLVTVDTPAGVEVVEVVPGSFADQAGLGSGDLVLELGRAGVFDRSDLWLLASEHAPGDEIEVVYVRGRELLGGRGTLAPAAAAEARV